MDKVLFKATATATDEGVFTAVISAQSVDREGDRVNPDAMVTALKAWEETGKNIPLHWNHSGAAEDVFGHVVPGSAKAIDGEVHVEGWVDQTTPRGADAWRLIKSGTLGFSFGYLIPDGGAVKNAHGGLDINALDVFEVTATPTPMNNDTRVTGWKGMESVAQELQDLRDRVAALEKSAEVTDERLPAGSVDPLREEADRIIQRELLGGVASKQVKEPEPEPRKPTESAEWHNEAYALVINTLTGVHT